MHRREFLIGGAGAIAGVLAGRYSPALGRLLLEGGEPSEVLRLDTWLAGLQGIAELGERRLEVLAAAPAAGSGAATAAAVDGEDDAVRTLAERLRLDLSEPVRVDLLERRVRAAIAADYREGRICDLDGWQISETECGIAALYVLRVDPVTSEAGTKEAVIVEVTEWGPRSTSVGEPFNVQPDGHSGLWFQARGAPDWLEVVVDGDAMPTVVTADVVTSGLHGATMERVLSRPGLYPIVFMDEVRGVHQTVGHLEVRAAARWARMADGRESAVFCAPGEWGPRETIVGRAVNPQDDGSIGVWVRIGCAPLGTTLLADDRALPTTVRADGRVTARLPLEMVARPRTLALSLYHPGSREVLPVGRFVVHAAR